MKKKSKKYFLNQKISRTTVKYNINRIKNKLAPEIMYRHAKINKRQNRKQKKKEILQG